MATTQVQVRVDAELLAWIDGRRREGESRPELVRRCLDTLREADQSKVERQLARPRGPVRAEVDPRFK